MVDRLRVLTIHEGEQAIIKVDTLIPITLEFEGVSITLWANDGVVFQRIQHVQEEEDTQTEVMEPMDDSETQPLVTPPPIYRPHVTIRDRLTAEDLEDIETLHEELFCYEAGETQMDNEDADV